MADEPLEEIDLPPQYDKDDMRVLWEQSREGSPAKVYLEEVDYDPVKFREYLESYHQKKEIHYLFEVPFREIPLLINNGNIHGYLRFRCTINK